MGVLRRARVRRERPPPPPPPPRVGASPAAFSLVPAAVALHLGVVAVGSDVGGDAAFEAFGDAVAVSLDGTRVAVVAERGRRRDRRQRGRVRVYERVGGAGD